MRVANCAFVCTSAVPTSDPSGHVIVMAAPTSQLVPSTGSVAPCAAVPPLSVGGSGAGVGSGIGVGGSVGSGVVTAVPSIVGATVGMTGVAVGTASVSSGMGETSGGTVGGKTLGLGYSAVSGDLDTVGVGVR